MTAIEMAKSKLDLGCGRESVSAMMASCGSWVDAISTSFLDLSDATVKILGLTVKYLPFPHPMSRPIAPGGRSRRKRSTIGHGCIGD